MMRLCCLLLQSPIAIIIVRKLAPASNCLLATSFAVTTLQCESSLAARTACHFRAIRVAPPYSQISDGCSALSALRSSMQFGCQATRSLLFDSHSAYLSSLTQYRLRLRRMPSSAKSSPPSAFLGRQLKQRFGPQNLLFSC